MQDIESYFGQDFRQWVGQFTAPSAGKGGKRRGNLPPHPGRGGVGKVAINRPMHLGWLFFVRSIWNLKNWIHSDGYLD